MYIRRDAHNEIIYNKFVTFCKRCLIDLTASHFKTNLNVIICSHCKLRVYKQTSVKYVTRAQVYKMI